MCNSFSFLPEDFEPSSEAYAPTFLLIGRIEGRMQQRFENMCHLRKEVVTLHRAHWHPNNRTLLLNLEVEGIPQKHLKRYILAFSCDACRAEICQRDNKTSVGTVTKRSNIATQKKVDKAQCKLSAQQKSTPICITTSGSDNSDALEISPIMDISSTITESLTRIHEFTAPADNFDYSTLKPSNATPTLTFGGDTLTNMGSECLGYQSRFNENISFRNLQEHSSASILITPDLDKDANQSPTNTDLQMDWADCNFWIDLWYY